MFWTARLPLSSIEFRFISIKRAGTRIDRDPATGASAYESPPPVNQHDLGVLCFTHQISGGSNGVEKKGGDSRAYG